MRKFQLFEIGLVAFVALSFLVILTENIAISLDKGSARPVVYVALVGLPIVLLWTIYSQLFVNGDLVYAFRLGLLDLAIASSVLIDFIGYYCKEIIIHM